METVFLMLLLVVAVIVANAIFTRFKQVPVAFLEIVAGLLLSLVPLYRNYQLEPELFLFAVISVLMFNDGQNTNLRRLSHTLGSTMSMSVTLALITVAVVAVVTHWMMPVLVWPLAFILGAIITPTDAVAVSSITNDLEIPKTVMGTLENESLFNDASGLVAFNLAVAAMTTGHFSVASGIGNFFYVFVGGILLGLILGWLIVWSRIGMVSAGMDAPAVIIPYNLLTPFIVYLAAEAIGVSGILAVVATGMMHGWQQNQLRLTSSRLQIATTTTWQIIASLLNGTVFVLLGVSLPGVITHLQERQTNSLGTLILLGCLLYLVMIIIRFLWVHFNFAEIRPKQNESKLVNSCLIAINGVHGTITLAMAFSLPLMLNGRPFPYRTDLIFISAIVILLSLLVPTIVLKLTLPSKHHAVSDAEVLAAKNEMVTYAIRNLHETSGTSPNVSAVSQILVSQKPMGNRADRHHVQKIMDQSQQIESETINDMVAHNEISPKEANFFFRVMAQNNNPRRSPLRQVEFWIKMLGQRLWPFSKAAKKRRRQTKQFRSHLASASGHHSSRLKWTFQQLIPTSKASRKRRQVMKKYQQMNPDERRRQGQERLQRFSKIETQPYQAVMDYLDQIAVPSNYTDIEFVRRSYDERHRRWNSSSTDQDAQNELLIAAFQQEYTYVQNQVLAKKYSSDLANQLYDEIATDQMVYMQSTIEE